MRRFHVSLVPPELDAPLAVARPLVLLLLLAMPLGPAAASVDEMTRPLTLLKSGCALVDRSRREEAIKDAALAEEGTTVLVRNMALAVVGDAGAVKDPLGMAWTRDAGDALLSIVVDEDGPTSGSRNVGARGVRNTGEG